MITVNLTGAANVTWYAVQHMIRGGGGRSSTCRPGRLPWRAGAARLRGQQAGLNAFGQSLAQALGPHGIAVTGVSPGFVETDMAASVLDGPAGDEIRA